MYYHGMVGGTQRATNTASSWTTRKSLCLFLIIHTKSKRLKHNLMGPEIVCLYFRHINLWALIPCMRLRIICVIWAKGRSFICVEVGSMWVVVGDGWNMMGLLRLLVVLSMDELIFRCPLSSVHHPPTVRLFEAGVMPRQFSQWRWLDSTSTHCVCAKYTRD